MDPFRYDPWVETEQLPLYVFEAIGEDPEAFAAPPVREAFRVLAPPMSAWVDTPRPTLVRGRLWVDVAGLRPPVWSERDVRRLVLAPFPLAVAALRGLGAAPSGWLVLDVAHDRRAADEYRAAGALHVHRGRPLVPVDVVLAPWSASRTELLVRPRLRRCAAPPSARYFDVAHSAIDALRDAIEISCRDEAAAC